MATTIKL